MNTRLDYKNFAVFTVDINSVERKISRGGQGYALASATLSMQKGEPMPLRIVGLDGIASAIIPGKSTLVGGLGYDVKEGQGTIVFFPTRVEPAPVDGKLRNYVYLTLRAGQDSNCRYSDAGNFWGRVRMVLSQGRDLSGNYKPSLWLTVKGFTDKDGKDTVPLAISDLRKGDLATITGRLIYEISKTNNKAYISLIAYKVEGTHVVQTMAVSEEDCPY